MRGQKQGEKRPRMLPSVQEMNGTKAEVKKTLLPAACRGRTTTEALIQSSEGHGAMRNIRIPVTHEKVCVPRCFHTEVQTVPSKFFLQQAHNKMFIFKHCGLSCQFLI